MDKGYRDENLQRKLITVGDVQVYDELLNWSSQGFIRKSTDQINL